MPANRVPNISVPPIDPKTGGWNVVVWRFLASIAAQFSGVDAPIMPVDTAAILSVANAQARVGQTADHEARDLALAGLRPEARMASDTRALDLATVALARIQQRPAAQPAQIVVCTQATFPALAGTGPAFIYVSDFAHWIFWDGTTPTFADGGSNYYAVGSAAPGSIGWHAVDGSAVSYLNADGTLTAKTLKNVAATPGYLKVGAGADTLNAPVAPTFTGTPATPAGTIGSTFTGTPQTFATVLFQTLPVTGTGAISTPNPYTPAGTVASTLTGTPATPAGTISTAGEPENFYSTLWFRL